LFYDSEFGAPQSYFKAAGIDPSRVLHTPVTDIEQLKFDIMAQLAELKRGDRVIILIDSIGNLASKKEVEDALEQKGAADMTRAKQLKSLFRMVTPHLTIKNVPCVAINHIYMEQGMYPKAIVSGGTGIYLSADTILIVGRQQEKDGTEIIGYNFILNIEKSRYVREKSKVPVSVTYNEGVSKWSGLLDLGVEAGLVVKPKVGWYARVGQSGEIEGKNWRKDDTECEEFLGELLRDPRFKKWVKESFQLGEGEANPSEAVKEEELEDA
jgi:RecA/RadA recombinase